MSFRFGIGCVVMCYLAGCSTFTATASVGCPPSGIPTMTADGSWYGISWTASGGKNRAEDDAEDKALKKCDDLANEKDAEEEKAVEKETTISDTDNVSNTYNTGDIVRPTISDGGNVSIFGQVEDTNAFPNISPVGQKAIDKFPLVPLIGTVVLGALAAGSGSSTSDTQ